MSTSAPTLIARAKTPKSSGPSARSRNSVSTAVPTALMRFTPSAKPVLRAMLSPAGAAPAASSS